MYIQVEEMLQKEMTRLEFLGLIGTGILSIIGVSALIKTFSQGFKTDKPLNTPFGTGSTDNYGGLTKKL